MYFFITSELYNEYMTVKLIKHNTNKTTFFIHPFYMNSSRGNKSFIFLKIDKLPQVTIS